MMVMYVNMDREKIELYKKDLRLRAKIILALDPREFSEVAREMRVSSPTIQAFLVGKYDSQLETLHKIAIWVKREEKRLEIE